ncbi:MAG TPA: hypothetical protein VGK73_12880, partial [Polyangiaceae bacterium]
ARRARDPLLLAQAGERGRTREKAPALARRSQAALEEAERELARVALSCAPSPCEIEVDGAPVKPGRLRLLPGRHVIGAKAEGGARTTQELELAAGAERELRLEVLPVAAPARAPEREATKGVAASSQPSTVPAGAAPREQPSFAKPLFYAGLGTTAALAAITTWSGIDTLNARSRLPGTQADNDAVRARARRTDALLVGTVLVGAATAYVGIRFLTGERSRSEVAISAGFGPDGGAIWLRGTQ